MCYHLLASLGLMYIIKYGSIFEIVRNFISKTVPLTQKLFNCSMCLGFWTGLAIAPVVAHEKGLLLAIIFPLASAAWCNAIDDIHDIVVTFKTRV